MENAYHVFVSAVDALKNGRSGLEVYVVEARKEDFVAGGWWDRRGAGVTAGFLDLNVIGPYTGND